MRPILTVMSLTGALWILSAAALPSLTVGAEPADHAHTHAAAPSGNKIDSAAVADAMRQMASQSGKGAMSSQMMQMMQMMMDRQQMSEMSMGGMPMGGATRSVPSPTAPPK